MIPLLSLMSYMVRLFDVTSENFCDTSLPFIANGTECFGEVRRVMKPLKKQEFYGTIRMDEEEFMK